MKRRKKHQAGQPRSAPAPPSQARPGLATGEGREPQSGENQGHGASGQGEGRTGGGPGSDPSQRKGQSRKERASPARPDPSPHRRAKQGQAASTEAAQPHPGFRHCLDVPQERHTCPCAMPGQNPRTSLEASAGGCLAGSVVRRPEGSSQGRALGTGHLTTWRRLAVPSAHLPRCQPLRPRPLSGEGASTITSLLPP